MTRRFGVSLAAAAASIAILPLSAPLQAAELPPIKASDANKVAECATPGRLMAYLKSRNDKLAAKYEVLATEYMRHGETLGLRWDYAFFQMLLETGYLKYTGDVKPEQNNFAGLGATGGGARGESFKDVPTGARAHLEHLLMYSGEKLENPTAQRTRNIQDWGVLTSWQQGIKGPITFAQLAKQWAPGTKTYASDIQAIAQRFLEGPCKGEDPHPEYVAEARAQTTTAQTTASATAKPANEHKTAAATEPSEEAPAAPASSTAETKGTDLARRAVDAARADGAASRAGLGAATLAKAGDLGATPPAGSVAAVGAPKAPAAPIAEAPAGPAVKILNPAAAPAPEDKASKDNAPAQTPTIETASVAGAAKDAAKPDKKAAAKCRVWTASYGGAKAIIIKATADQTTNYTVLDVNEGAEKREADAYISAYAKGGESVGEYASQTQALDKAFELCPEG
jgi:hypothetical protein